MNKAAERRATITKAISDWRKSTNADEGDIAFEAELIALGIIKDTDTVESFYWNGNATRATRGIVIITDSEEIFIDCDGNTSRGAR